MKINIQNIKNNLVEIDDSIDAGFLKDEFKEYYPEPFLVHVWLDRFDHDYRIKVVVKTTGCYTCDRCLASYTEPFEGVLEHIFQIGKGRLTETEDVTQLPGDAIEIDISPLITEIVTLNHPVKMVCKDDCKGLCPGCGADLNYENCTCSTEKTDPRWDDLRKFIK